MTASSRRILGPSTADSSDIVVSPVAMGCWPITGMTSLDVTREQSEATLLAAFEAGINFFDTAYMYGANGESESMIAKALGHVRDDIVIATKAGLEWDASMKRRVNGKPTTIKRHAEISLRRLQVNHVELLYLHAPDPSLPLEDTAGAFAELRQEGKTRLVGVSNLSLDQLRAFHAVCPVAAIQPPYNMLQREIEADLLPWCQERSIACCVYWPLMKGLLAGKLPRDHVFVPEDGRTKYPMFQGEQWQKNQDFLDELRPLAATRQCSMAELVVNWTIQQPGITAALTGAKRPEQIQETAQAMTWRLTEEEAKAIEQALARRGKPKNKAAV